MGDDLTGIEPVSRLTGLIGLVAQAGATLEVTLHSVHQAMAGGGGGHVLHQHASSAAVLIDQCQAMLEVSRLSPSQVDAAGGALENARAANRKRNNVVHGLWIRLDDERLENLQQKRNRGLVSSFFTEEEVVEVVGLLARADVQMSALQSLAFHHGEIPHNAAELGWFDNDEHDEAVLRGEFDLVGLGAYQLHRRQRGEGQPDADRRQSAGWY